MNNLPFLENALFTFDDVLSSGLTEKGALSLLARLKKKGAILRLRKSLYGTINPITKGPYASRYEIGCAIHPDGVIGYLSALNFYGLSHQANQTVTVLTPLRYGEEDIEGTTYRFVYGDTTRDVSALFVNAPLRVCSLERAVVDCLDRPDLCGGNEEIWNCLQGLSYLDEKKVISNLEAKKTRYLYKKVGFVLQTLGVKGLGPDFFDLCKQRMSQRHDDMRDYPSEPGLFSAEWNLVYPEYMKENTQHGNQRKADERTREGNGFYPR